VTELALDIEDLRKKADAGNVPAQSILGGCYLDGIDVEPDYREAFRLLKAAADKGASRAVVNLARMYQEGLGVQKAMKQAVRLYESVASTEFLAQIALGRIYARGEGLTADRPKALHWYTQASGWVGRVTDCAELREAREFVTHNAESE